jgi:UDP-glucose 4-epimerase
MIYGKGSKGNYPRLAKLSRKLPIFPDYDNKRSMLYIENLCEFIRLIITNSESGYFYPQNEQYVKTTEMVKEIAKVYKKKIYTTKIGNLLIRILKKHPLVKKVFGNLYYAKEMSNYKENYCLVEFKESIRRTEG